MYLAKTWLPRFSSWGWNFTVVHAEEHIVMLSPRSFSGPLAPANKWAFKWGSVQILTPLEDLIVRDEYN